ncbi:MAG: hypothetical protein IJS83_00600 [Acholeplasmatales bacterium]|nr:hypothetical protein [Acholeplasmatales bacterium]
MKKVLFISTTFNSYYKEIIDSFEQIGYEVDWYSDRPSNSIFTRAMIRLNPNFLKRKIKKYSNMILENTKNKIYDLVFVILGQSFDESFWEKLKESNPKSKFVYYLWDSSINFNCIEKNYKFFDIIYSFDKNDCAKFGFNFHPLFYTKQFYVPTVNIDNKFDFVYIGTVKPGRYKIVNDILNKLESAGLKGYKFFYLHSKKVLTYYKFKYKNEFKKVKANDLYFNLLSKDECFDIENKSRIIVDVPQPGQLGLTIRIFEALGMQKKIITTNSDIKNYDFYNEDNIYILDNENISFDSNFFTKSYSPIDEGIRKKYFVLNWLKYMIGE